jgi:septum formation protein
MGENGAFVIDQVVLGSRSPRRIELLSHLVPLERIVVRPPSSPDEAGFDGLTTWGAIEAQLAEIARTKNADVRRHSSPDAIVLTADTTVVAGERDGELVVLGQPPQDESWPEVVRGWFRDHLAGRTHFVLTAICLSNPRQMLERTVRTAVTFAPATMDEIDWYVATGEPQGKAGGYAVQGAGSRFVTRIDGSPSNVVGLPLAETAELLAKLS